MRGGCRSRSEPTRAFFSAHPKLMVVRPMALGNVYSDQQRWGMQKNRTQCVQWSPKNVDALIALSVVLVQPEPAEITRDVSPTPEKCCASRGTI